MLTFLFSISFMREGMIVIEDFNGATLSTFSGFMGGKVDTKELFDNIQENIPARIRQIILLDAPWYVRVLIALVKPFMKKRMREKVGTNLATIAIWRPTNKTLAKTKGYLDKV